MQVNYKRGDAFNHQCYRPYQPGRVLVYRFLKAPSPSLVNQVLLVKAMHTNRERIEGRGASLTRHGVAVEVLSDGLLQLVVCGGLLEAQAQVVLQVLVQFVSCQEETNRKWV